ncbi:MAG: hypothetical protein WBI36_02095 [Erysipelotrichaceae bacterium]
MKTNKENLILIVVAMIILGTHFIVGCCKEPPPVPPVVPPVELEPQVQLTVTPEGVIPYGEEKVVISWTTENANHILINGERQPSAKSGTFTILPRLFKDTTFNVKAINVKKVVEKDLTLNVGDWTTSTFGLVSYYPWKYKEFRLSSLDGEVLVIIPPSEIERSWVFYYHKNGKLTFSPNLSNETESWSLVDDNTIIKNNTTRKLQVSQKEMIISYQMTYKGQLIWVDLVHEHASDIPTDPD